MTTVMTITGEGDDFPFYLGEGVKVLLDIIKKLSMKNFPINKKAPSPPSPPWL
jgi:hypothetical protein